jgi:hypothetical protein
MAFRGRSILKSRLVVIGGVAVRGAIRLIAVSQIRFIRAPAVAEARGKAMPEWLIRVSILEP